MRLVEKICEEIGVEVGEIWKGDDGFKYCVLTDGRLERVEGDDGFKYCIFEGSEDDISRLLTGELKPVWQPEEGETYYVPEPVYPDESDRYKWLYWYGRDIDNWYLENNFVFKTEEEAIAAANEILKAIKEAK